MFVFACNLVTHGKCSYRIDIEYGVIDHVQVVTPTGWPAVSTPVLRSLAGRPGAAKLALAELTGDTSADAGGSPV
jgi:hypothetical protein